MTWFRRSIQEGFDPASGRHRAQLVHHDGGGPYEFELADGSSRAWYAVSPNYAPSLYALNFDPSLSRMQVEATPDEQRRMVIRRECAKYAEKYIKLQAGQMMRLLTLADYDHPYLTMAKEYEQRVLEAFAA